VLARQQFTGKERDAETGLDYFESRYFSAAQRRFTSPDETFAGQSLTNPQSWNMYAYALNNPLMITDPTGREPCVDGINPLNGNICTEVVLKESSRSKVKVKERTESGVGAAKELYNMFFGLLNYTPAGLLYQELAGKPGVEPLQSRNTNEYTGMREMRLGSQFMLIGELTIPAEIQAAAQAISHGHAFRKHNSQFTRFGVASKQQFQVLVKEVIENAKGANVKNLSGGRSAYWDDTRGIVVIHDPSMPDKGTAFIPDRGRAYFDGLR
jgi:RHS repeat-associated protein